MTRRVSLTVLALLVVVGLGGAALARPGPASGRVLYLRLRLAPYVVPGTAKEVRYWIDAANGRLRYEETLSQSGSAGQGTGGAAGQQQWYAITLSRRGDGSCGVAYTNLLGGDERGTPFACRDLLALDSVRALDARVAVLRARYGRTAHAGPRAGTITMTVPAGTDPIPLMMDHFNMRFGYEKLAPGMLTVEGASGRLVGASVYRRSDGPPVTMTEYLVEARDLPLGALPGDFFDAPRFSLPDRAPGLYRWLHKVLPWHP